ncbi:MAG: nucleoside phosphorylase [Eudoraea sp.]|nr:nucleoside phosphorylase [Eudoraea sp.]
MQIGASELILNEDNSIYHINLLPQDLADTVILVGDQNRVSRVSKHFDTIEVKKNKREFITHTGTYRNKRISVISTGIGTDNIDIVLNELDALVNIDFDTRTVKKEKKSLDLIRIGTSGAIQEDIPLDSFVASEYAIGFDSVLHYYKSEGVRQLEMEQAFIAHAEWPKEKSVPYIVKNSPSIFNHFMETNIIPGFTGSNVGFYGPQGRSLRLVPKNRHLNEILASYNDDGRRITNLEMETSAIYGLADLLGHRAISMNCIIANRSTQKFSKNPAKAIDDLILWTLNKIVTL